MSTDLPSWIGWNCRFADLASWRPPTMLFASLARLLCRIFWGNRIWPWTHLTRKPERLKPYPFLLGHCINRCTLQSHGFNGVFKTLKTAFSPFLPSVSNYLLVWINQWSAFAPVSAVFGSSLMCHGHICSPQTDKTGTRFLLSSSAPRSPSSGTFDTRPTHVLRRTVYTLTVVLCPVS